MREELNGARHKEIFQIHMHDDLVFQHFKIRNPYQQAANGAAPMLPLAKNLLQYQRKPRHQSSKRMHKRGVHRPERNFSKFFVRLALVHQIIRILSSLRSGRMCLEWTLY